MRKRKQGITFLFDSYYKYQFTFLVLMDGKPVMKMNYPYLPDSEDIYRLEIRREMTLEDFDVLKELEDEDWEAILEYVNKLGRCLPVKSYVIFCPLDKKGKKKRKRT